ncbi:MAG: hypothetical protein IKM33_07200 [Clostridia bacterium]|nr:hypothetical protein [Clostridia bacterium]
MTSTTQDTYLPRQCFAASNSCKGFKNYYGEVFADTRVDRLYVIKGGPGTGKSHFMRTVARHARQRDYTVVEYLCSSDPASLDGLILSRQGYPTVGVIDGTPPHGYEPTLPGAWEDILNLGAFWDFRALAGQRETVAALVKQKSVAYANAYAALSAAGCMDAIADALTIPCVARDRISALANRLLRDQPRGKAYSSIPALRRGVSMAGKHTLHSYEAAARHLLIADEGYGMGYRLTEAMLEVSLAGGHEVLVSYHPVYPHKVDGLFYPATGLCVLVGDAEPPENIPVRSLSLRRYADAKALRAIRGELRRTLSLREQLTDTALRHLSVASTHHFELEKIYAMSMDFAAKEAFTERFCEGLFE